LNAFASFFPRGSSARPTLDSPWPQALSPLENPAEHGENRIQYAHSRYDRANYRTLYSRLYGAFPVLSDKHRFPEFNGRTAGPEWQTVWSAMSVIDQHLVNQSYSNPGKAVAAYERLLLPGPSRFDRFAQALANKQRSATQKTSALEILCLQTFTGKERCTQCYNGPLFSKNVFHNAFHNISLLPNPRTTPDIGRRQGVAMRLKDPFNCHGSSSAVKSCDELT
tara:strand:- start:2018 stop:2686 length:669 start_codon:yes stop_codon:yes gene_type:complete